MGLLDKNFNIFNKRKEPSNTFSLTRLKRSFRAAFDGIKSTYKREQNIKIYTIVSILLVIFGLILKINYVEWLICFVLIGFMLMAEFFNTAIEHVVDLCSPNYHPLAKKAKDTAAAGVLMMAFISALVGLIIFVPKLIDFIGGLL